MLDFDLLAGTSLFEGIDRGAIGRIIGCTGARHALYGKGEVLVREGEPVRSIGVVLMGSCRAVKEDPSGRTLIVTLIGKGGVFGDVLAGSRARLSPVTVMAQEDMSALLIPGEGVMGRCARGCPGHDALLRNYVGVISEKYLALQERIDFLTKPTVREKILSYLTKSARENGARLFTIPLDRRAMAEYLNVERSALSRELSRMKRDGVLDYHKNGFRLI